MSDKIIENNQVTIMGEVASQFTFSHEGIYYGNRAIPLL